MRSRRRIANDELAQAVGLELNKNKQYTMSDDQWRKYFELTLDKESKFFNSIMYESIMRNGSDEEINNLVSNGILKATQNAEVRIEETKHLWIKKDGASLFVKNPHFKDEYESTKPRFLIGQMIPRTFPVTLEVGTIPLFISS